MADPLVPVSPCVLSRKTSVPPLRKDGTGWNIDIAEDRGFSTSTDGGKVQYTIVHVESRIVHVFTCMENIERKTHISWRHLCFENAAGHVFLFGPTKPSPFFAGRFAAWPDTGPDPLGSTPPVPVTPRAPAGSRTSRRASRSVVLAARSKRIVERSTKSWARFVVVVQTGSVQEQFVPPNKTTDRSRKVIRWLFGGDPRGWIATWSSKGCLGYVWDMFWRGTTPNSRGAGCYAGVCVCCIFFVFFLLFVFKIGKGRKCVCILIKST